jgi:hypothetical protein
MFAPPLLFEPNISCLWCQVPGIIGAFGIVFNDVIKCYKKISFEKPVLLGNCYFLVKLRYLKQLTTWKMFN